MNGIFWKKGAPAFFTAADMKKADFKIRTIADITCDIAPDASVPSTLDASTILKPIFGYDIDKQTIAKPFKPNVVDVMSIDNLPNELPRDASESFGNQFINNVLFDIQMGNIEAVDRATIVNNGVLQPRYEYLTDYVYDTI